MEKIKTAGYFVSEPFHWVDWHAGNKFEGNTFYVLKFKGENCFLDSVQSLSEINIDEIVEKENYGNFNINGNILEIVFNPTNEFKTIRTFTILEPELLLDENLKEYRYIHKP